MSKLSRLIFGFLIILLPHEATADFSIYDSSIDPKYNSSINPKYNSSINPKYNSSINPKYNSSINPKYNSSINPKYNSSINPKYNSSINPKYNSSINPKYNSSINPKYNSGIRGGYLFDLNGNAVRFLVRVNRGFFVAFDSAKKATSYWVYDGNDGFVIFDWASSQWISFASANGSGGLNVFTLDGEWVLYAP